MPPTKPDVIRDLMHDLRDPIGALVIRLALLDDEELSADAQDHVDAMLLSVHKMVRALTRITEQLRLEVGDSTPLAIISQERSASSVHRGS